MSILFFLSSFKEISIPLSSEFTPCSGVQTLFVTYNSWVLSASAGCILREQASHAQINLSNYLTQAKSSEVPVPMAVLLLKQSDDFTWNHESFSSKPTSLVTNLCFLQPKDPDFC